MSLNWVQVTSRPIAPVPLPGEKLIHELPLADVELEVPPSLEGPKWSARTTGKFWITNQRVIFATSSAISSDAPPPAHSTPATSTTPAVAELGADSLLSSAGSYLSYFLGSTSTSPHPPLQSLSLPLSSISQPAFTQPLFGANLISLSFVPSPGGGFPEASGVQIGLKVREAEGGIWGAYERLVRARERAQRGMREEETETLPAYSGRS